jgi:hypothetical protein
MSLLRSKRNEGRGYDSSSPKGDTALGSFCRGALSWEETSRTGKGIPVLKTAYPDGVLLLNNSLYEDCDVLKLLGSQIKGRQRGVDHLIAKVSPFWRRADEQGISADFLVKVDDVFNVQSDPFVGTRWRRTYQTSNP